MAAGALFATTEVIEGRTRHDHRARSAALIKEHAAELGLAERVLGAVLAALAGDSRSLGRDLGATWSPTRLPPLPDLDAAAHTALAELTGLQARWTCLRADGSFDLEWPAPGRRRAYGPPIR